jgi:acetyl-CoA/propionyl-CoA carboxylase biotin carboxyl carrier protein
VPQERRDARRPAEGSAIRHLFIANRGEIAVRIGRKCDRLGVAWTAPRTDGPGALDLLDAGAVVGAAQAAGADAVHPGYGFLAENAEFAESVVAAGLRWIGPPATAIRAMGDKATARRLAHDLRIPTAAGYDDADQSDETLVTAAAGIGYPVLVKPAAGGGGKGMRIVRTEDRLVDALGAARREARSAFADDRLVLERFLEGARHVEIQVLFDERGAGVHLGERDCSVQRRHQKVLEETPSPGVDEHLRNRLGDAALRLAAAVGYAGAGTCEFLVDGRGRFFFLEMNTRLQVEHPVTELVTGRDLVADQLAIAAGAGLDDIGSSQTALDAARASGGHAVEVRLYAEDAEDGFLPSTGMVVGLRWPSGDGIRVDAGIGLGTEVGRRFDPMLAKVVAHAPDRDAALARLTVALDETLVLGLTTNLRFLRWLVRQPAVVDGRARTDTLERTWPPDDWTDRTEIPDEAWAAAAMALGAGGWRLNGPAVSRLVTDAGERTVRIAAGRPGAIEAVDEAVVVDDVAHVDVAGRSIPFRIADAPETGGAARAATAAHHGDDAEVTVTAPMPGVVLAVHRAAGDALEAGQPIATLEAMKMEHAVTSPIDGRVLAVEIAAGDQVNRGQALAIVAAR